MDPSAIGNLVEGLWPLVASGAIQRVGERGTDEAADQAAWLWRRIKERRRQHGLTEVPASREELHDDLTQLTTHDQEADRAAQIIVNAVRTNATTVFNGRVEVVNEFHGPVEIHDGNFGVSHG